MVEKNIKGITLIALIVTIIVLLILAGISIAILTGPNGILNKANKAKEEMKKAEYLEELRVIGLGLQPDRTTKNWDNQTYMNQYKKEIEDDDMFNEAKEIKFLENMPKITIQVITKESWVYWVTEDNVEYKGTEGENIPPDLNIDTEIQTGNVTFNCTPSKWTNEKVTVEITTTIKGYQLQYCIGADMIWKSYTNAIEVENNETAIYARLINDLGEAGNYATANIENIDRLKPQIFAPEIIEITNSTITLRGNTQDQEKTTIDGCSGIDKYYFSKDNGATWEQPEQGQKKEQYTFSNLESEVIYNLKMKAVDKAGNEIITETIEQKVEIKPTGIYPALEGNTLKFYTTQELAEASGGKVYGNIQGIEFVRDNNAETIDTPWFADKEQITAVEFVDEVAPEYLAYYFSDLSSLETVNMEKVKTINVTNMYGMFLNCRNLKEINTKGFDTRNVENMGWMFLNCSSLTNLDVTMFDTKKVTNMEVMFNGCSGLTELNVSNFDTSNVTTMRSMFANMTNLKSLELLNFDTSNVTNMETMFHNSRFI